MITYLGSVILTFHTTPVHHLKRDSADGDTYNKMQ